MGREADSKSAVLGRRDHLALGHQEMWEGWMRLANMADAREPGHEFEQLSNYLSERAMTWTCG